MNTASFVDRAARLLFIVGLMACSFVYGVAVPLYRLFPYELLREAKAAADALTDKYMIPARPYTETVDHDKAGVTVYDSERAFNGLTFLMAYTDEGYKALLIDMEGRPLHEWTIRFSQVWPEAQHVISRADDDEIYWHGMHLFPNGDLLFNFGGGTFPYGGGLVKIDKDSKILWALARNTHHDLDVAEDEVIYVAAHNHKPSGLTELPYLPPPFYEDVILKVSPQGEVLDEISMLKALQKSSYSGLLAVTYKERLNISSEDPLHLNAIEILTERLSPRFAMFDPGDLLVSFRNINTIAVIDPESKAIKWAMTGKFVHQHDPDFLENGNILLFDNAGGGNHYAQSRILEIDPVSQKIMWSYEKTSGHPFFSRERGNQEALPNGNILIVESDGGRVFEVTREPTPEIVWEYYNRVQSEDDKVGWISAGLRFRSEDLTFLR